MISLYTMTSRRPSRAAAPSTPMPAPAGMLLSFATLTLVLGLYYGPLRRSGGYVVLNESLLRLIAISFGLFMLVPYRALARRCFGASEDQRAAALLALLFAIPGFPLSSYVAVRAINRNFDSHEPRVYELRDVSVGASGKRFVLRTSNWPTDVFKPAELRLSEGQALAIAIAGEKTAMLHVGSGALGFEWIRKFAPAPPRRDSSD